MIDPQLKDRVVLITGANHGIGAAAALAFAVQSAKVFIAFYRVPCRYSEEALEQARAGGVGGDALYRARQQQSAEPLAQEIRSRGGDAHAYEADLGDPVNVGVLFDRCEAALGPVDILVNNHAHCMLDTFDPARVTDESPDIRLTSAESIDTHFRVNAQACALMMAQYVQRFLARNASWGRIINVSTDAAHCHNANVSYAASKHAIESYSRSAASELGKYGITVNIVAPGPIQTGYIAPASEKDIAEITPLRRVGRPEDVADVIVFLASEQARWLTGQLVYVGGGCRMHQ
jgi:3-oxoacyl-[acyl-carrier protein] reductase